MKTKIFCIVLFLIIVSSLLYGQKNPRTINSALSHPWWIVDGGGGKSTVGGYLLQASIGQPSVQSMSGGGFTVESGFIPGLRTISSAYTTHEFNFADGWNMISVPLLVNDYRKTTLFSTAMSAAFSYEGSYQENDTLKNGSGYWLKFTGDQTGSIIGSSYMLDTIDVIAQWNMIGANSLPVPVENITPISPVTISSEFFGYEDTYVEEDTLKPGGGYWVKVSEAGKLILQSQSTMAATPQLLAVKGSKTVLSGSTISKFAQEQKLNTLDFTDAGGKSTSLYFSAKSLSTELGKFDLPPSPPSGIFDVRFKSNRKVILGDQKKIGEKQIFPIQISGKDPFTISWQFENDEHQYALQFLSENSKLKTIELKGTGQMTLNAADLIIMKLVMFGSPAIELPKEFALHQNYPNPFNPTTTIEFDLLQQSIVTLKVYNMLGQEVAMLLDHEDMEDGTQEAEFNASTLSSGVYFYRLVAEPVASDDDETSLGTFTQVKKMLLVK